MIESGGANIQLTAEQNLQILEWQRRLSVIQNEIKIAETNLNSVKTEIETRTKHNSYLEEEGKKQELVVATLTKAKEEIESAVVISEEKLAEHLETTTARNTHLSEREADIAEKHNSATECHAQLDIREEEHNKKAEKLSSDQLAVEQARDILVKALESIKL